MLFRESEAPPWTTGNCQNFPSVYGFSVPSHCIYDKPTLSNHVNMTSVKWCTAVGTVTEALTLHQIL